MRSYVFMGESKAVYSFSWKDLRPDCHRAAKCAGTSVTLLAIMKQGRERIVFNTQNVYYMDKRYY